MKEPSRPFTLKMYLDKLNDIAKKVPGAKDMVMIYSCDEEGNNYDLLPYLPAPFYFDPETFQIDHHEEKPVNAICVN